MEAAKMSLKVATEAVFPRYRWVIISLLCAEFPINSFVVLSIGILLPFIRKDMAITDSQAGLLSAAGWMGPMILAVPASLLVVRLRPKPVFAGILLTIAGILLFHAWAPVFIVLFLARLLYSCMQAFTFPTIAMLRTQWIPKREMAMVSGIQMGSTNIGQSLALVMAPVLIGVLNGWRPVFVVYAIGSLVVLLFWLKFGKERRPQEYVVDDEVTKTGDGHGNGRSLQGVADFVRPMGAALRYKEFALAGFAIFGNVIPYTAVLTFWPSFLFDNRDVSRAQAGLLMAFLPIGGIVANLLNGYLSDRIGLRRPFVWPFGIIAPAVYIAMVMPLPLPVLGLASFFVGYLAWCPVAPLQAIIYELPGIKPKEIAAGFSVSQTIQTAGFVIGPIFVGLLSDALGGDLGMAIMLSTFGPLSVVIAGLTVRETGRRGSLKATTPLRKRYNYETDWIIYP